VSAERKYVPPVLSRATDWSVERIEALSTPEARQLLVNAERLGEEEIAAQCKEVLGRRPRGMAVVRAPVKRKKRSEDARRLVSRARAFGVHGIVLESRFWSRSGLNKEGGVMFALWAEDVKRSDAGASYLLWAPNVAGARPWSDKPGGQERLEHAKRALKRGAAEGLFVYGTRLEGVLPEEKAANVEGADAESVVALRVEKRGEEYWAVWGEPKESRA